MLVFKARVRALDGHKAAWLVCLVCLGSPAVSGELSHSPTVSLATMERRDEHNLVSVLQLVVPFALELPICIINKHEDSWTSEMTLCQLPLHAREML